MLKNLYPIYFILCLTSIVFCSVLSAEELSSKKAQEQSFSALDFISEAIAIDHMIFSKLGTKDLRMFSGFSEYDKNGFDNTNLDKLPLPRETSELKCLAEAIYFEARGETLEGQFAVGEVIINRVISKSFPDSICRVISEGTGRLNACQFSYNCDGKLETITERGIYERILKLSRILIEPSARVLTGGATFYHAKAVSPSWSKKFKKTREIGQHIFYKAP